MVEGLVRRVSLVALVALAGCKGCQKAEAPPSETFDCGATRGVDEMKIVRPAPGYPSPRACLADKLAHCFPAKMQHLDEQTGRSTTGEVLVSSPGACEVSWSTRESSGAVRMVGCKHSEMLHKVGPGGAPTTSPNTDRILLTDCADGEKHML